MERWREEGMVEEKGTVPLLLSFVHSFSLFLSFPLSLFLCCGCHVVSLSSVRERSAAGVCVCVNVNGRKGSVPGWDVELVLHHSFLPLSPPPSTSGTGP